MDRCEQACRHEVFRFPRTRGDGPEPGSEFSPEYTLPPHARGWTDAVAFLGSCPVASPARAGMDPLLDVNLRLLRRFPRTRGDGPPTRILNSTCEMLPPHARGWTSEEPRMGRMGRASPARAGMDRRKDMDREAAKYRFPRTRGDGPVYNHRPGGLPSLFPPHARGWTRSRLSVPLIVAAVSPARAGMDHHSRIICTGEPRLIPAPEKLRKCNTRIHTSTLRPFIGLEAQWLGLP